MSTIERAATRLGSVGKGRAEPILRGAGPVDNAALDPASVVGSMAPIALPRIGGGFCEVDIARLTAAGFATPESSSSEIAADLRRIKRPLLMALKKSAALGNNGLPHNL